MKSLVEINKYLVLINSGSALLAKLLNIMMLVWVYQFLLKRISPEEFSIYPVIMSIMVFMPLVTMVLTSGVSRYLVDAYAKGDLKRVTEIVSTMSVLLLAAGCFIMLGGGLIVRYIDRILTIDERLVEYTRSFV